MIRLKIESNGTAHETKVIADGVDISKYISAVIWRADCDDTIAVAWLRCPVVEVSVEGELEDVTTLSDRVRRFKSSRSGVDAELETLLRDMRSKLNDASTCS